MSGANWEIWLCDPSGTRLAMLDRALRFSVSRVANGVGAAAIDLPKVYNNLIGLDYILEFWRRPAGGALKFFNSYFIRRWRYAVSQAIEYTQVWGYDPNYLLAGRIVAYASESSQALKTTNLDDMIKAVFTENLGSSGGAGRDLSAVGGGVSVQGNLSAAPSATKGFSWDNVLTAIVDQANASRTAGTALYFDLRPRFTSSGLINYELRTYVGVRGMNHSQDSVSPVYFGNRWGNLEDGYYELDHVEELNYIYGRGQGLADNRYSGDASSTARINASIWNRREGYANASAGGGGESNASTQAEAQNKLAANRPKWRAGGSLLDTTQARYDIDWGFGDKIVMEISGRQVSADVNAVSFSVDEMGLESPDFRIEVEEA